MLPIQMYNDSNAVISCEIRPLAALYSPLPTYRKDKLYRAFFSISTSISTLSSHNAARGLVSRDIARNAVNSKNWTVIFQVTDILAFFSIHNNLFNLCECVRKLKIYI